jgi:DNA-binding phage protein
MIIRTRKPRREVTRLDINGKPMLYRWRLSNDIDTPKRALEILRLLKLDMDYDIVPHARMQNLTEVTVGLIRHHNLADLAKATGLPQRLLKEACEHGWKGTLEVIWAVWEAFGYDFSAKITPIATVTKKKK